MLQTRKQCYLNIFRCSKMMYQPISPQWKPLIKQEMIDLTNLTETSFLPSFAINIPFQTKHREKVKLCLCTPGKTEMHLPCLAYVFNFHQKLNVTLRLNFVITFFAPFSCVFLSLMLDSIVLVSQAQLGDAKDVMGHLFMCQCLKLSE